MLDSIVKAKNKCHPQMLLGEFKYEPKKIKMENLIEDNLEKVHLMSRIMKLIS